MNLKQNPFSLYDFLGYFTPGAIFLYCILLGYAHMETGASPQVFITENLGFDKAEIYIPLVLGSYALGHLLSFLSSLTIERFTIWAHGYPSKYLLKMEVASYFCGEGGKSIKVIIALLLLPISAFEFLFGYCLGLREMYTRPLDKVLRRLISGKINRLVINHGGVENPGDFATPEQSDFFRYAYHYAVEFAPNHFPKMQNYVALYGFLRTLAFLSILISWGIFWHIVFGTFNASQAAIWLLSSFTVSFVFYLSFLKFYRRFSLEALMALAVTYKEGT